MKYYSEPFPIRKMIKTRTQFSFIITEAISYKNFQKILIESASTLGEWSVS